MTRDTKETIFIVVGMIALMCLAAYFGAHLNHLANHDVWNWPPK